MNMFPRLSEKAIKYDHLICNDLLVSGFSTLLSIKTKSRNCLNERADMPIAISNKVPPPPYEKVLCNTQELNSH